MPVPVLRADLLASGIFQRTVDPGLHRLPLMVHADLCLDAAAIFIERLKLRDPETCQRRNDGLPADVDETAMHEWQAPTW